jgi:hypothetical protein
MQLLRRCLAVIGIQLLAIAIGVVELDGLDFPMVSKVISYHVVAFIVERSRSLGRSRKHRNDPPSRLISAFPLKL